MGQPNPHERRRRGSRLAALLALVVTPSCTTMSGGPSLTLLSRADLAPLYEPVTDVVVEVEECSRNVLFLFFFGNARPTHEGVIDLALERYDADVLLDAEITTTSRPFVLYNERCTRVRGTPARRRREAPPPAVDPGARASTQGPEGQV